MQANSWHHKSFANFWKVWKTRESVEGKFFLKFEYLENEKNFLDEIKSIFHSFWRAILWENQRYHIQVLKLVSAIFIKLLFFNQMIALQKLWKNAFYLIKKALFVLKLIRFFSISVLPSFTPCQHCFRGW